MRIFLFLLIALSGWVLRAQNQPTPQKVKTIGIFDPAQTKSGYWINGYCVELSNTEFEKYKGKKVKVAGELLIVEGIDPKDPLIVQGSLNDRKFIVNAKIKIIK